MDYSKNIFGNSLNELTYQTIENYFQEAKEESDYIEFKSFHQSTSLEKQFEGIYIALCALLNSEGGILIWGAPTGTIQSGKKEKLFHGVITPISPIIEKDRLINKITFSMTPIPAGIKVKILENQIRSACIYVFEVQKSEYAPHQTASIYYMRLDGQSIPAPHHYVEALFRQIKYPDIKGLIKFIGYKNEEKTGRFIEIEVSLWNYSPLQNEELPTFILSVSPGHFLNQDVLKYDYNLNESRNQLKRKVSSQILHFGLPIKEIISVYYPHKLFESAVIELDFVLQFGGRYSPAKTSIYRLNINKPEHLTNLKKAIKGRWENILLSDTSIKTNDDIISEMKEYIQKMQCN